jgi:hypothetical protein
MATRSYTLYTPVVAIGNGVGTLTLTDTNDDFFEIPDTVAGGQTALVDGLPVTINSIEAALGPEIIVALVDGVTVNLSITPVRIVVESGILDDVYIVYPGLPEGAVVISVSLPLVFPTPVGLPVCLTVETKVMTDHGLVRAGDLRPGDMVLTQDDGLQPIRWIGAQTLQFRNHPLVQKFRPIVFEPGALEQGVPATRLTVSPQHAILLRSPYAALLFGESEVFVAAKHLVNGTSIRVDRDCEKITYCHILLDMHAIILAEGAEVESLYLGDVAMRSIGSEARAEIFAIFPGLRDRAMHRMERARLLLREFEARVLANRIWGHSASVEDETLVRASPELLKVV